MIVGEALSCMVNVTGNASLSNGLKLVPNAPTITHLQFAVDTLNFYDAKEDQIKNVIVKAPFIF